MRQFLLAGLLLGLPSLVPQLTSSAYAQDEGILITVEVVEETPAEEWKNKKKPEYRPIPTAVVRHPSEAERHRVNTVTGQWQERVLYMPDGTELIFDKGMELPLEVSAPGYESTSVIYTIKARKNLVRVVLKKMEFSLEDMEMEDPVIQFGRDKPIQ